MYSSRSATVRVAELTRYLPVGTGKPWPRGMRVVARRERPHPGAQLRITDRDGRRITVFATKTPAARWPSMNCCSGCARAEDRIRCLKDTGLRNLPLHDFAANQIWLELIALAADLSPGPNSWPSATQHAHAPELCGT